jgi:type VI secretion system protein VasG
VELVHWLHELAQAMEPGFEAVLQAAGCNLARVSADLATQVERLPDGASEVADFSPHIEEAFERAWLVASLRFGSDRIQTGHVLAAVSGATGLRHAFNSLSSEFSKLHADRVEAFLDSKTGVRIEAAVSRQTVQPADKHPGDGALARFTTDLTREAREGRLDPVLGREREIRQCIDILMRRRQNNPLLAGDAGVGKTSVVEGLALRIASGDVPPALAGVSLLVLDIGLLTAGSAMRGEFEQRLRSVIDEVRQAGRPAILFVDEVHMLIGAGGTVGTGDAANLLKPALARGEVRLIGATTWDEYKRHIEPDPALTRRFQAVLVPEPDVETCIRMLRGVAPLFERHHGVRITESGLAAAAKLSHRHLPERRLPDKAISLLDTASARAATARHAPPPRLLELRERIHFLDAEIASLAREGARPDPRLARLRQSLLREEQSLGERFVRERELIRSIESSRGPRDRRSLRGLLRVQQDDPLIPLEVDEAAVASVLSDWTGIPSRLMLRDDATRVLGLCGRLQARILGQAHAMAAVADRIQAARAGLSDPGRPLAVLMFAGPSGSGKTETARFLASDLIGGDRGLVSVNLSEFREPHTISTLRGSPPGYVGHGIGGVLTEAVRRRPHCVLLLDEFEKAHPDVQNLFLQIFDSGRLEDADGIEVDFRNTLIVLTSNAGAEEIEALCADDPQVSEQLVQQAAMEAVRGAFPAPLVNRLSVIGFRSLGLETLRDIASVQLGLLRERLASQQGVELVIGSEVAEWVARNAERARGARGVESLVSTRIQPQLGRCLLQSLADGRKQSRLALRIAADSIELEPVVG